MEPVTTATKDWADRDWTVADTYAFLPESGTRRFEVIDGELFVNEASPHHQRRIFDLAVVLDLVCPPHLHVSGGPVNLDIGDRRHLEPDLVVKNRKEVDDPRAVPLLVVEVLSPSNRRHDTQRKRAVYEELGVPSYWLVDPFAPSVTVLELGSDRRYVERAHVRPGDAVEVTRPFLVRLAPGEWTPLP